MSMAMPAIAAPFIHSTQKRKKNVWYSIKDGNWTDSSVWASNALSLSDKINNQYPGQTTMNGTNSISPYNTTPLIGDDVIINHAITLDTPLNNSLTLHDLIVNGSLTFNSTANRIMHVLGLVQVQSLTVTNACGFYMWGNNIAITSLTCGATSTIGYCYQGDQNIMDFSYGHLLLQGGGTKYATNNLTTAGDINLLQANRIYAGIQTLDSLVLTVLDMGAYNLFCGGNFQFPGGILRKQTSGSLVFVGVVRNQVLFASSNALGLAGLDFSGNPTVECRGAVILNMASPSQFVSGTGTWRFTTNNQGCQFANTVYNFNGPVLIVGAITVTNNFHQISPIASIMQVNDSLNGTVAGSAFVNKGNFFINFSSSVMTTGSADFTSTANNVVGYVNGGSYTLQYSSYQGLTIRGTGTKTAPANMSIAGTLQVGTPGFSEGTIFELGSFNLAVTGTTTLGSSGVVDGFISKASAGGSLLFTGLFTGGNSLNNGLQLGSNPSSVEFRGGITVLNPSTRLTDSLIPFTFTTNNQTVLHNTSTSLASNTYDNDWVISGAIKVTFSATSVLTAIIMNGVLNGNNALSEFDNRNIFHYKNATAPMVTGILTTNAATNTFKYNRAGNQDVKGGTYRTIEFGGSGVKKLLGNVIVNVTGGGGQSTTGTATIDLNGFTITTI